MLVRQESHTNLEINPIKCNHVAADARIESEEAELCLTDDDEACT